MKYLLVLACVLVTQLMYAQETRFNIKDEWFHKYGNSALKIGDTLPDIPLGSVINNYTGKTRFSEFKGKLIILDFWSTGCSSCISNFGHLEELQQEFKDQIQIFLVNIFETKEDIENRLKGRYLNKFKLPNLPCIVAEKSITTEEAGMRASAIRRMFPSRGVPYHVWIDMNGVVRLKGGALNTYSDKIRKILKGEEIFVLNNSASVPLLSADKNATYHQQLGQLKETKISYGSIITGYNNELEAGPAFRQIVDSSSMSRTTYFMNEEMLTIYMRGPFKNSYLKQFERELLYSPTIATRDLAVLPKDVDTLKFTSRMNRTRKLTDSEYIRSRYCYEQIVPLHLDEETRLRYMLDDLNRYFGDHYQVEVVLEEREYPCYSLVNLAATDRIAVSNSNVKKEHKKKKRESYKEYKDMALITIVNEVIRNNPGIEEVLWRNKERGGPFLIFNGTSWDDEKRVDLILPGQGLRTIDELKQGLRLNNLDLIETRKRLKFLVVKKRSSLMAGGGNLLNGTVLTN